jgi:hypothetical protein
MEEGLYNLDKVAQASKRDITCLESPWPMVIGLL